MTVADASPVDGPRQDWGDEHEALAAKLLESGLKIDSATLAAAAAGLKDTSVLEKQLRRSREVQLCNLPELLLTLVLLGLSTLSIC